MSDSDACKAALDALYAMARLRKLELDVDTDEDGDYFEFVFDLEDRYRAAKVSEELYCSLGVTRMILKYGKDFRTKVYLADCTPKEEKADVVE